MHEDHSDFPRPVYGDDGRYTIRQGAVYRVESEKVRELAEIEYARRDLEKAHELMSACTSEDLDLAHPLLEEALCSSAIVAYAKPFTTNHARSMFRPGFLIAESQSEELRALHDYVMRCRDWMIAHDDGLGESKDLSIYLPSEPPRMGHDIGLHSARPRVVALGTDISHRLEPHFAKVLEMLKLHESERRRAIAASLLDTRFSDVVITGVWAEEPLDVGIESVLSMPGKRPKRNKKCPKCGHIGGR